MSIDSQWAAEEIRGIGVDSQDVLWQGELVPEGQAAATEKGVGKRFWIERTVWGNIETVNVRRPDVQNLDALEFGFQTTVLQVTNNLTQRLEHFQYN